MKNFVCMFAVLVFSFSAMADETKLSTPLTNLESATNDLMKNLDENKAKQFSAINNSYGIIKTIEDVQQSISKAVISCSQANPTIQEELSGRFEVWKETIRPVMKQARSKLDKMILLQGFAQPSQVRAYLKKFDEAVIYRNQSIEYVPIQKLEECQKLQSSMDRTQKDLVNLITESLALNADVKVKE